MDAVKLQVVIAAVKSLKSLLQGATTELNLRIFTTSKAAKLVIGEYPILDFTNVKQVVQLVVDEADAKDNIHDGLRFIIGATVFLTRNETPGLNTMVYLTLTQSMLKSKLVDKIPQNGWLDAFNEALKPKVEEIEQENKNNCDRQIAMVLVMFFLAIAIRLIL